MGLTFLLLVLIICGVFLMLWAGVAFIQDKKCFTSAPKDVQAAIQPRQERFKGAHALGWFLRVIAAVLVIGSLFWGILDGIHRGCSFGQFFLRFLILLEGYKIWDMVFLDWYLLTKSRFYQHYFPEVEGCESLQHTGFNRKSQLLKLCLFFPIFAIVLALVFTLIAGSWYYHAGKTAQSYMKSDDTVQVKDEKNGWLFDGPGEDTALIFYPGALVQAQSYAPVLHQVAEEGYDCYLVKMPLDLAILGQNKADDVMEGHPAYTDWYIGGHSLGGAMAASYAAEHTDKLDGIVFLAAYSTKSLQKGDFRALSIYGSRDGVLNREHYQEDLKYQPKDFTEIVIDGGNHARFGDYGKQKGDNQASIPAAEQWKQTAAGIVQFIETDASN